MKHLFIITLLATAATAMPPIPPLMDIAASKCELTGSGSVVCRSCPSMTCDKMASWSPGNSVNVNCMCHGQKQGGVDSWLYVKNKDCYIRQPRTDCCESCMPVCNHCPCTGNNCGGCSGGGCGGGGCGGGGCGGGGGGGGGGCGSGGCGGGGCGSGGCGGGGGGGCGGGGCGGGGGGCTGSHCNVHDDAPSNETLIEGF